MKTLTAQIFDNDKPITSAVEITVVADKYVPAVSLSALKIPQTIPPPVEQGDLVPLRCFDPGYKNTTVCKTSISLVEPDGACYYRGYSLEELVARCSYLEVSYLLIHGELPNSTEFQNWTHQVLHHTYIHTELQDQMKTFRYDAHPMGMFLATLASLSTFHPEANPALRGVDMYTKGDSVQGVRNRAIFRMLGKSITIACNTYRHRIAWFIYFKHLVSSLHTKLQLRALVAIVFTNPEKGRPYNHPMPNCTSYAQNILYMLDKLNEDNYRPDSRLVRIIDKMLIILAEHGSNCSAVMMRHLASSGVDPYTALAGAGGALFGERKSSSVIDMIKLIGSAEDIPSFLEHVANKKPFKNSKKPMLLLGFGHRIYKSNDPRAKLCRELAFELFDLMGKDEIAEVSISLEEKALNHPWFQSRGIFPNVDYWAAIVFHTLGFPQDMFPVWMMIPRVSGFIAHWVESIDDPEYKIYRPRQIYTGIPYRVYDLDNRSITASSSLDARYSKSDPQAALRRNTGEPRPLVDIMSMIAKTENEIQRVKSEISNSQENLNRETSSPSTDLGASGNAILSMNWMAKQYSQSSSITHMNKKLDELLSELQILKDKQRKMSILSQVQPDVVSCGSKSPRAIDRSRN